MVQVAVRHAALVHRPDEPGEPIEELPAELTRPQGLQGRAVDELDGDRLPVDRAQKPGDAGDPGEPPVGPRLAAQLPRAEEPAHEEGTLRDVLEDEAPAAAARPEPAVSEERVRGLDLKLDEMATEIDALRGMLTDLQREVASLTGQLVALKQALARGMTRSAVQHRVSTGRLLPVHRGVYRAPSSHRCLEQDALAACLACGEDAVASHAAAAALFRDLGRVEEHSWLAREGGDLALMRPDGSFIDRMHYGAQETDFSAAREPDGSE